MDPVGRTADLQAVNRGGHTVKFVRQSVAVVAVVAAILVLGVAWGHSGAAGLVADDHAGQIARFPDGARLPAPEGFGSLQPRRGDGQNKGDHSLSISNVDDLVQTLFIEGAVLCGVVIIDRSLRQRRRRLAAARVSA